MAPSCQAALSIMRLILNELPILQCERNITSWYRHPKTRLGLKQSHFRWHPYGNYLVILRTAHIRHSSSMQDESFILDVQLRLGRRRVLPRQHQRWAPLWFACKMEISCGFFQMGAELTYAAYSYVQFRNCQVQYNASELASILRVPIEPCEMG